MPSTAHRLTRPSFTANASGIDIEGIGADGNGVKVHLLTEKGLDPAVEAAKLKVAAERTDEVVVATRSSGPKIDGAVIDAVRSDRTAVYSDPTHEFLPRRGALASLAARITGAERSQRAEWRITQSGVMDSIPSRDEGSTRDSETRSDLTGIPGRASDADQRIESTSIRRDGLHAGFGASGPGTYGESDAEISREIEEEMELRAAVRLITDWNGRDVSDLPIALLKQDHDYAIVPALQRTIHPDYRETVQGAADASGYPGRDENSEWSQTPHARILAIDEGGMAVVMTGGSNDYLGADWYDVSVTSAKDAYTMIDDLRAETREPQDRARGDGIVAQAIAIGGVDARSVAKGPAEDIDFGDPTLLGMGGGMSR